MLTETELVAHLFYSSPSPKLWSEKVLALLLTPHQHLNVCAVHCSRAFLCRNCHFQHQLLSLSLCTCVLAGLASSRPAPAFRAILSCITSYAYRLRASASARRIHREPPGRRLRENLKQLRVAELLNLEHRESSHDCTSCSIGGTVRVGQLNTNRARTRHVRKLHNMQHRRHSFYLPGKPSRLKVRGVRRLHNL